MKEQSARLRYLKMAPRKVRLVADAIKKMPAFEAEAILSLSSKKASEPILKLLRSAMANAKNNQQLDASRLFVKEIRVDHGPMMKRFSPRAMGRATMIQKKSSHITLVLAESDTQREPRFKMLKKEKAVKAEKVSKSKKEMKKPAEMASRAGKRSGFIKRMFRRKSI